MFLRRQRAGGATTAAKEKDGGKNDTAQQASMVGFDPRVGPWMDGIWRDKKFEWFTLECSPLDEMVHP